MLTRGSRAPAIELIDLSESTWQLSEALASGPVLLAFFKISCPTCRLTLPFLQRLAENATPASPALLAVSQDDAAVTRDFLERFNLRLPTAVDKGWDFVASNAFGITNVPSLFLIEPGGEISLAIEGFVKTELEKLGPRFGTSTFLEGESVPELRPG